MSQSFTPRVAETSTTTQTLREENILHVLLKPQADVTLEAAEENHRVTRELAGDKSVLVLVDVRPARSITREARMSFSDPEKRANTIAQAMIVDSGISKVMGNLFIGLNKPDFPVRLFTSEDEAIDWLRGFSG